METLPQQLVIDRLFGGDSQAERILQGIDWNTHGLGPVSHWPATLRTALRICLTSRHAMIIWWGKDLTFFYNDAYAPTLGKRHPTAMGQPGRQVWPEIWDVIGPMLQGVMSTGRATWSDDQLLFLERNGYPEETYHSFSYSPIENDDGAVEGVFTAVTETTQRVLAERRAALAHELAGSLVDAHTTEEVAQQAVSALAAHTLDIPTTLIYRVEPDGATLTCLASTQAQMAPSAILDGKDPDSPWSLSRVLTSQEEQVVAWGKLPFTGDRGWAPQEALVMPIIEPGNTIPTLIWVAGISPRRELESEYRALFTLLQNHIVTSLASVHAYEVERHRAEALATLDRAKTAFFSNVSHEFRTPLALLLGPLTDSLADTEEPLPEGHQVRLALALRNGQRLLKLVNNLLDFSRIEAGRIQATFVPTYLSELTVDLASTFRSLVEQAGMQLIIECPPLAEPVYVDRDMWEKIVLNLLSNAFKFTFEGSILVRLNSEAGHVALTVQDTGTGIPPEELSHLFERFHRVEGARARTQEGSGIGLALVQELAQLHGGTIAVASAVGQGTTFTVTLPLGKTHLPADRVGQEFGLISTAVRAESFLAEAERWLPTAPPTESASVLAEETPSRDDPLATKGARVLLVDDNTDMRDYLARLLGNIYHVRAVANGNQALSAIYDHPPDLVLSDVMMPEMDGFGLLHALRTNPRTASIPVILLSARAGEEATIEGLEAGADDYLVKPFSAREVLARVSAHLALARLRQEVQRGAAELAAIFEAVTDGVGVYDRSGNILRANAALQRQLARVFGDPLPTNLSDLAHQVFARNDRGELLEEESWPNFRMLQGEILTGETAMELEVQTKDDQTYALSLTGAPLRDDTGAIVGAVVVSRDVTERRRQELVVRERARQLQAIFAAVADGIVLYDTQGKLVEWNAALATLFEFDLIPEYPGLPVSQRPAKINVRDVQDRPIPAAMLPFMRAARGEVLTGTHAVDLHISLPSGRELRVSVSAAPLRDDAGNIVGAVAVYHDVTERRQLERHVQVALAALLELTADLVGVAPDVVSHGIDPLIAIGSRLVALVKRVFRCDVVAMGLLDPLTGNMKPAATIGLAPDAEARWWHDIPLTPLQEYVTPDVIARMYAGEPTEIDFDAVPLLNGADYGLHRILLAPLMSGAAVVGFLIIQHNHAPYLFTDGDRELILAMGRVSALAIERDRLLRDRVTARAREVALEESNRRMNEFLGIASHELRTPLTSVIANTQLSQRTLRSLELQESSQQQPKIDRIRQLLTQSERQLGRLNRLIGDLLDISRINAGKLEMRMELHDIVDIVREGVQSQRSSWPHRVVEMDAPKRLPITVLADADRIEQVVVNFVTNALKYSSPGQPVRVRVRQEETQVRVSIEDHGPGLTDEQQAMLFERFARVASVTQLDGSGVGLGLGLYICKTIIDRHGGTIGVQSQVGLGSTFFFTLPCSNE